MRAQVRAAAAVAVLSALGSFARPAPPRAPVVVPPPNGRGVDGLVAMCPPGSLPEGPVCVPFEGAHPALQPARGPASQPIPRRPDRPEALAAYLLPAGAPAVAQPTEPYPALELTTRPGERVTVPRLTGEEQPAEVLFAGELPRSAAPGATLVTRHTVRDGGRPRTFVAVLGPLDALDPSLAPGVRLAPGTAVGLARDRLTLELREVREGSRPGSLDAKRLRDDAFSTVTDPRNALALAGG